MNSFYSGIKDNIMNVYIQISKMQLTRRIAVRREKIALKIMPIAAKDPKPSA